MAETEDYIIKNPELRQNLGKMLNNPRMEETEDHIIKNPELRQNLGKMLNNPRYSDTVFLVNKTKFNASSHLVCFASPVLESMLDIHYENCTDREIRIGLIKHNESFSIILNFIYGLEVNCTKTNLHILCEALSLSEQFKLKIFTEELKRYLSNIKKIQLEFLVVLLNTSKKFHLDELYDRLSLFAYEHADELVEHENFVDLQYDVLRDLLKADNFFTDEINILKSALKWHADNMSTSSKPEDENERETVIELNDVVDANNDAEDSKKDDKNGAMESEETNSDESTGNENSALENVNHPKDSSGVLLKEFSKNILKSLLSHIRFSRISIVEIFDLLELQQFTKYKEFLINTQYFSAKREPRTRFGMVRYIERDTVQDVTKKFVVNVPEYDETYESNEEYLIGDIKWKICMKETETTDSTDLCDIYLKCISDELLDWKCTVECQLKMIPYKESSPTLCIPGNNSHTFVRLTSDNSCVNVGTFYIVQTADYFYNSYDDCYSIEVHFKNIHTKVKIDHNLLIG